MTPDAFVDAVRRAVSSRRLADPGGKSPWKPRLPAGDPVELFRSNLEKLGGTLHVANEPREATAIVAGLMSDRGPAPFLSWDAEHLPVPDLLPALFETGHERQPDFVPVEPAGRLTHQIGYYDCAVGLTGASAGLADTGSLILASGPGRSRMASLIPEAHIAVLDDTLMWPSLSEWISDHPDAPADAANWTIVTGPSRTADIEQVITHGVHGPREVHVVLVNGTAHSTARSPEDLP